MRLHIAAIACMMAIFGSSLSSASDNNRLVILHTNDTHSQIEPTSKNQGGIARRKVLVDSVRAAEKNVMLVDAGDALQGTLYFSLFGGEVERNLMNALGYDIQILGNHEFDNGMEALAELYKGVNAEKLTSNYRLDKSTLKGMFKPYTIRQFGDRKIGFIAINLLPKGMIADSKCEGVEYLDGLKAANAYAWILKNMEGCDMVVALSHIGYSDEPGYNDPDIAKGTEDIDVIIGGHSHTVIDPDDPKAPTFRVSNLKGEPVLIAQTGKSGPYLGQITIDLDNLKAESRLIPVDKRLDSRIDPQFEALIVPYRHKVDSVMNIKIGYAAAEFNRDTPALDNLIADAVFDLGTKYSGKKVDMAIMNHGGLRTDLLKGDITKGNIMQIMPFDNYVTILEIKGSDLIDALNVMAGRGGTDGVSSGVKVTFNKSGVTKASINGKVIDPDKTYTLATINYLAEGGDYMVPLTRATEIAKSNRVLYDDIIDLFIDGKFKGKKLRPDLTVRMAQQ